MEGQLSLALETLLLWGNGGVTLHLQTLGEQLLLALATTDVLESIALMSSVLGMRSQILMLWIKVVDFFHSPAARAFEACMTWSRVFSGGPVKI